MTDFEEEKKIAKKISGIKAKGSDGSWYNRLLRFESENTGSLWQGPGVKSQKKI